MRYLKLLLITLSIFSSLAVSQSRSSKDLVSIDFPEPTDIKDVIRTVALWTNKNVIMGRGVRGKIQMISPRRVTKVEAYQAFLSALEVLNLTTVETGKVIKIIPSRKAYKENLQIYQGTSWAPRTDNMITQIVPLKYISARQIRRSLSRIISSRSVVAHEATNTLIISDTGHKVRKILQIIELIDVSRKQPTVALVAIRHADAKTVAKQVNDILQARSSGKRRRSRSRPSHKVMADERTNSVIVFGPTQTLNDIKALIRKFDIRLDSPDGGAQIHVRYLDYVDAKKLATTLSSLVQGNDRSRLSRLRRRRIRSRDKKAKTENESSVATLSSDVKITADESANALVIKGTRLEYRLLNRLIRQIDQKRAQVYLEMDILDIKVGNNLQFGTSIITGEGEDNLVSYGWQGGKIAPIVAAGQGENTSLDTSAKQSIAQALGKDFTLGILSSSEIDIPGIGSVTPGALISMLKADGTTRILSSPHILTVENEEAKIVVGNKLFFKSAQDSGVPGGGAVEKVEEEDADLSLEVTPNVSHDGRYVTMKIDIEANEGAIDPSTSLPNIIKRQTSVGVTVKNGQTAVISGLRKQREEQSYQKIPLLGDIPVLGWLFRNTNVSKDETSLMITLKPHVIFGANDLQAVYDKKLEERADLLKGLFGDDPWLDHHAARETH
ncbi:type II secretion system secretin GspD [Pseudobacteriovorax antillogorgiicola]|uniref:Type II secretion system protein D n=1 Tax=Pseudobacteriovorax antillogorgiicola TaxID=1513793 RepID=A0A1Y6CEG9_9BACT|nr:type II secretion system secretin GspD [Pseudobacteriovorax antillogorgiicola]TCS48279.1 type II secretion system protein D [Pseudobacteriovorax antillogorgiicola]SMF56994.1 type II secretion system protein D [Pseudobacteriovorax antillogorgiicola]